MPTWAMWALCVGLLLLRGLLAAAESALYATSDLKAKELKDVHPRRGARLLRLKTEREPTAASIRFGMVLFGSGAAAIAAVVPPRLLNVSLAVLSDNPLLSWLIPVSSALLVAILASVLDVSLRAATAQRPHAWALGLSGFVSLTVNVLYPLMRLLVVPVNLVLRPFGTKVKFEAPPPPLEELEKLIAAQAASKHLDKGAPQLIRSIFELSDKTCRDVMVPRMDVVVVDAATSPAAIVEMIAEQNHSRIPVFDAEKDRIVGILHVRDLVPLMQNPTLIVMQDLIRPAVFVPWVKPIGDLLREMQKQKIHMAVVVDEYGGFTGIVTLEDILREIVGDIGDEFEEDVKLFEKQSDGSFLIDASLAPADFTRAFDFTLPEGEYETMGGFLAQLAGAIPEVGDRFNVSGWVFIVTSKTGPRLDRIKVVKPKLEKKKDDGAVSDPYVPRASAPRPG